MNIQELMDRIDDLATRCQFQAEPVALIGSFKIKAYVRILNPKFPTFYISAGVHGDEPAGPLTILRLLRNKAFSIEANWVLIPIVNPRALAKGTRENPEGVDVNRDYGPAPVSPEAQAHLQWLQDKPFDLALCLHEDSDAEGFYLYELFKGDNPKLTDAVFTSVSQVMPIDLRSEIDGMPAANGIMQPPPENHQASRQDLPEALRLFFRHTPLCYTFETPSKISIASRVDAQTLAVHALFSAYLENFKA